MNNTQQSCPPYGHNSLGLALLPHGKSTLVRIEHIGAGRMLHCREVSTLKQITIHATFFEQMPTIPSKYREYNFHALAKYWSAALLAYPKSVTITPEGISFETLTRKLRESRVAKETYGWKHTAIDEALWNAHAKDIIVTPQDNGTVFMGPKDAMELVAFEGAITSRNDILIEWTDKEQLDVFCNLASQRVFNPKPSFVLFNLDEATIADL